MTGKVLFCLGMAYVLSGCGAYKQVYLDDGARETKWFYIEVKR